MKTVVSHPGLCRTAIALAMLAAFGPAWADEDESVVEASVSAGAALVSGDSADRAIFGQYNGYRRHDGYGLLDLDYYRRDDEAGTVARLRGYDLLGETRELDLQWKRQGQWKLGLDYGELVRYEPYQVNTGLLGAAGTGPQVTHLSGGPGTGSTFEPGTKRKSLGMRFSKWLATNLQFDASMRTENKEGSRLFGRGFNCPSPLAPGCAPTTGISAGWATLMLPEPIDSNHTQIEARLSYATGKLRLSGGYYGSFFDNANASMTPGIPGALNGPLGNPLPLSAGLQPILSQAIALAPDNEAHHFDLAGNYLFTPTTRGRFKLGYSRASQTQDFSGAGLSGAPTGVSNLGGRVNNMLAQLGITSRPVRKLTLSADLRYEDRDDDTPINFYNVVGSSIRYTNREYSRTRMRGKLEARYQFNRDYRGTLSASYDAIDRGAFTQTSWVRGVSALRERTEESSYRAELRRRMTENFSGALALSSSRRDGSNWLSPNAGQGVTEVGDTSAFSANATFMPSLADRRRDKLRLMANWQASEELSVQFSVDAGHDRYQLPTDYGLRSTRMDLYSVDADYAFSSNWRMNGYLSFGNQKLNQARPAGYIMSFDNRNTSLGLGVNGKPTGKLEVGAMLSYLDDRNAYSQGLDGSAGANSAGLLAASGGLPDIVFRVTELRLYGGYKLSSNSSLRVDLIHQRARYNDWSYSYAGTPYVFGDNTTVSQKQEQNVTFVGVRYIYRFK